jgi:hypothetical protein
VGHICGTSICLLARLLVAYTNFVHNICSELLKQVIDVWLLEPFKNSFETSSTVKLIIALERIINMSIPYIIEVIECNEFICISRL